MASAKRLRERRMELKAAGICVHCRISPARSGRVSCESCAKQMSEYAKSERGKRARQKSYAKHRDKRVAEMRDRSCRKRYGLTGQQYDDKLAEQKQCAICGVLLSTVKPHLDHCHKTGSVRSFLCPACNTGVGYVEREGGEWLKKALEYIS